MPQQVIQPVVEEAPFPPSCPVQSAASTFRHLSVLYRNSSHNATGGLASKGTYDIAMFATLVALRRIAPMISTPLDQGPAQRIGPYATAPLGLGRFYKT